jgi:hypothetical protein
MPYVGLAVSGDGHIAVIRTSSGSAALSLFNPDLTLAAPEVPIGGSSPDYPVDVGVDDSGHIVVAYGVPGNVTVVASYDANGSRLYGPSTITDAANAGAANVTVRPDGRFAAGGPSNSRYTAAATFFAPDHTFLGTATTGHHRPPDGEPCRWVRVDRPHRVAGQPVPHKPAA